MKTRLLLAIIAAMGVGTSFVVACSGDDSSPGNPSPDGSTPVDSSTTKPDTGRDPDTKPDGGDAGAPTFDQVYAVFEAHCTSCHKSRDAGAPRGALSLAPKDRAYEELVNIKAMGGPCADAGTAGGLLRVKPNNADDSLLYGKVTKENGGTPQCGAHMPLVGSGEPLQYIPDDDIELIENWINAGAPR